MKIIPCLSLLLLSTVLAACNTDHRAHSMRPYIAMKMPGLQSPYTPGCKLIRVTTNHGYNAVAPKFLDAKSGDVIMSDLGEKPSTITASCLIEENGELKVTGTSTATIKTNEPIMIGSSEGSTERDRFAATHTTSGIFPIITTTVYR